LGSGIRDPGSGMGKNPDPGSGIRDKHPGSATLILTEVCFLGQQQRSDPYPNNPVATAVGHFAAATMAIILALALGRRSITAFHRNKIPQLSSLIGSTFFGCRFS
jgi:hypothetical protein